MEDLQPVVLESLLPPVLAGGPQLSLLVPSIMSVGVLALSIITIKKTFKEAKFNVFTHLVLLLLFWGGIFRGILFLCFFVPMSWKMLGFLLLFPQLCYLLAYYMHTNSWVFDILML